MILNEEQIQSYNEKGFLLVPEAFAWGEVEVLRQTLSRLFEKDAPARVLEKDGSAVRAVHGCHLENEVCARLVRHPSFSEPARLLLGGDVYVYQFKANAKAALVGDMWEWHQDYIFWRLEDGLPRPALTNAVVFIDDVTEINGPMSFLAGSKREGMIEIRGTEGMPDGYEERPEWISNLTADLKYSLGREKLTELMERYPAVVPKGPAGSSLFFHPNVVHGSAQNMSALDRRLVLVSYSHVENIPRTTGERRPEFLVSRDFSPIEPALGEGVLGDV